MKTKVTDETMFWYFYDRGNDKLAGQIGDEEITHSEAANAVPECTDDEIYGTVDCARGYDLEQNPFQESPGLGDDRVKDIED